MNKLKLLLLCAIVLFALTTSLVGQTHPAKPNFILVFIDDMGWADFSCFGNETVKTANIDRLASEGIRFHQFYVNSPICSPSRVAISTGMYPQRFRITSYLDNRKRNKARGVANWLDPKAPMLARELKKNGYATGHFGKWHMGGQRDVGDAPLITEYGFDESLTNFEGLGDRVLPLKDAFNGKKPIPHALGSDKLGRGKITWERRDLVTKSFTDRAIEFVKKSKDAQQPFYINLWPDDVHSPFFPPKARRGDQQKRTLYHGVLKTMDEQLGELFDFVQSDASLKNNTLILICSDNGPELGAGSAGPFRGFKTHLYEGGVRSPLIAWGPGLLNKDACGEIENESVIAAFDLPPSILRIANIESDKSIPFDGEEMSQAILGHKSVSRKRPVFFRRPPDRDSFYGVKDLPDLAIRDRDWKFYCEYDGSQSELYDLSKDRHEKQNIADSHPEIVNDLKTRLLAWHKSMPQDNGESYRAPRRKKKK